MRTPTRRSVISGTPDAAPIIAFATYIHPTKPHLLRRTGWEIGDDVHDNFSDCVSQDNGASWTEPQARPIAGVQPVEGGYLAHTENAALYLADSDTLIHATNEKYETTLDHCNLDCNSRVRIAAGGPLSVAASDEAADILISDFGKKQGLAVSFCHPIQDRTGHVLIPAQWQKRDEDRNLRQAGATSRADMPEVLRDYWECGVIIGRQDAAGKFSWRLAGTVPFDAGLTTRGLFEPAVAELANGRLVMVLRGSNAGNHELTSYKWVTFSKDGGETWSEAEPLTYDDGQPVESGSNGSALFRDRRDRTLYWLGNPAIGARAMANGPRSPLALVRVCEEPFVLVRESLRIIDEAPEDNPQVQLSNFKCYQDRESGELVVFLTRYGERGTADWMNADLYEYRVAL